MHICTYRQGGRNGLVAGNLKRQWDWRSEIPSLSCVKQHPPLSPEGCLRGPLFTLAMTCFVVFTEQKEAPSWHGLSVNLWMFRNPCNPVLWSLIIPHCVGWGVIISSWSSKGPVVVASSSSHALVFGRLILEVYLIVDIVSIISIWFNIALIKNFTFNMEYFIWNIYKFVEIYSIVFSDLFFVIFI